MGYQSTNIFRVYIPSEKKVIRTRDVTFNEQLLYDDGQPDLANLLQKRADQILEVINVSHIDRTLQEELDETSDEDNKTSDEIQVENGGNRQADSSGNQDQATNQDDNVASSQTSKDDFLPALPTPDETPEPQSIPTKESSSSSAPSTRRRPHYEYIPVEDDSKDKDGAAVKEDNIIKGKQSRRLPERYIAHLTHLKEVDSFKALRAAFHIGLKYHRKIHRDELPPPPKNWKELIRHQYREDFLTAATKEYTDLEGRGTFKVVDKTPSRHDSV